MFFPRLFNHGCKGMWLMLSFNTNLIKKAYFYNKWESIWRMELCYHIMCDKYEILIYWHHLGGLIQKRHNFSMLAMGLCLFCIKPLINYLTEYAPCCQQQPVGWWATRINPDSRVHGANMGPTWVLSAPGGPHVGPMSLAIWEGTRHVSYYASFAQWKSINKPWSIEVHRMANRLSLCYRWVPVLKKKTDTRNPLGYIHAKTILI